MIIWPSNRVLRSAGLLESTLEARLAALGGRLSVSVRGQHALLLWPRGPGCICGPRNELKEGERGRRLLPVLVSAGDPPHSLMSALEKLTDGVVRRAPGERLS